MKKQACKFLVDPVLADCAKAVKYIIHFRSGSPFLRRIDKTHTPSENGFCFPYSSRTTLHGRYNLAFMCYLAQHWPAIVQAMSAAIVAYLTYRLVIATDTYARLTRESLALSNKQFEQELLPNWHISFTPSQAGIGIASLKILNLSRNSARVTHLFIRVESETSRKRAGFLWT